MEYDDGVAPLDYDELKGLLPTHITARGELDFLKMADEHDYSLLLEFDRSLN